MSLSYPAAVRALEALEGRGMKLGLERTSALLDQLGRPQQGQRGVLVAGTNGKGSVCALIDSMVRAAGLRSVMLSKPHLLTWRERILVDGAPISEAHFASLVDRVMAAVAAVEADHGSPTLFEAVTAVGVLAAGDQRPDVLVCEVGLGGRLDSTNVLDLGVAVVTGIGMDHRSELGDDLASIAAEKAAIIKPGNEVVTGATGVALEVVRAQARRCNASCVAVGADLSLSGEQLGTEGVVAQVGQPALVVRAPLIGGFQVGNLGVAVEAARALRRRGYPLSDEAIVAGAAEVSWRGRMEWVASTPPLLIDGCHNPPAVAAMVNAAIPLASGRQVVAVFGAMQDKDVDDMLSALRRLTSTVVFTAARSPRACPPAGLAERWVGPTRVAADLSTALDHATALAGERGLVVVCGSLYLAGEAIAALQRAPLSWRRAPRRASP